MQKPSRPTVCVQAVWVRRLLYNVHVSTRSSDGRALPFLSRAVQRAVWPVTGLGCSLLHLGVFFLGGGYAIVGQCVGLVYSNLCVSGF
jgi:hypothetical protein